MNVISLGNNCRMVSHHLLLIIMALWVQKGHCIGADILGELFSFPLKENPFFAKVSSMGANMDVDGILVNDTDMRGYSCQIIGDLECEDGEMPACSGLGVIDCTGDCPGTEEEFKHFREVMDSKDFAEKFPKIAALSGRGKKPEKKQVTSDDNDEGAEPEPEPTEPKRDFRAEFVASLSNCKDFSEDTKALLSLVKGDGMQFGATSNDPNDLTYVAPGAISNISQIEYDYSEYYDEVDNETTKKRRDVEDTKESKEENVLIKQKKEMYQDKNGDKMKTIVKDETLAMNKKEYYDKLNGLDDDDLKDISEEDKINMNMIRSVDDDLELTNITITVGHNITEVLVEENVTETDPELAEELSKRVKREVDEMRDLFHSAVRLARDGAMEETGGARPGRQDLVFRLAHRMAAIRRKRGVEAMDKSSEAPPGLCIVKNMTCSVFPSKSKCRGIGIGRCGSNADLLKQLFTPHVVMVSSVSIIVIVMVTVGLSYYCYKLKTENRIEPSEDGDHEVANGGVKTLETNTGGQT